MRLVKIVIALANVMTACGAPMATTSSVSTVRSGSSSIAIAPQCSAAEYRGMDFWIGDWDLAIATRERPDADAWKDSRGANHIERVLRGCGIEESFHADDTGAPWAGKSLSRWVEAEKKWRQTWIDDSGSYLVFVGDSPLKNGILGDAILEGEAHVTSEGTRQMRMVFTNITPKHITWRWEATRDGGKSWVPMMRIEYTRRAGT